MKGFDKVKFVPDQEKTITINLKEDAFQYYNDQLQKWLSEPGVFDILVGSSSGNIRIKKQINL